MTEKRGSARHIRSHRYGPETKLIVWQQITREGEQQRQHQKDDSRVPVEFARFLVGAGEKHAKHVQLYGDDHQVRGPAVHIAKQLAKRNVVLQIKNVAECLHLAGVVVKHQQYTGEGEHEEQIKSDAAHSPGIAVAHCVAIDLSGVQMQKNVGEHTECAIARRIVVFVPENGSVELGLGGIPKAFDLFFGLRRNFGLEGIQIFINAVNE